MKITNRLGLPEPIVRAVAGDGRHPREENTFSATQLEKGVREILLTIRHEDELVEDASDRIWTMFGTALHKVCQDNASGDAEFSEERLTYTLSNGYKVSGIVDLYDIDKGLISDYKTTSAWKIVGEEYDDWKQQGLTYAWLLRKNDLPAEKVEFYALLKDFSKRKAATDRSYPQTSVVKVSFDVNDESLAWIDKMIRDKIDLIDKYKDVPDDELPLCTEEGRVEYICARCGEHAALSVTIPATGHDMVAIETDDSIYHVCDNGCGYYYKEDKDSDDAKGGIGGGSGSGFESGDDESGSGSAGGSSSSDNEYIENKPNYVPITPSQNGGYVYSSFDVKSGKIVRDESLGVAFTWEDSTLCATVTYADDPYTFIPYDNGDWLKTETEYTFILYSPLYDSKDSCVYGTDYYCYVVTLSHSWTDWTYTAGDCTHGGTEERYCRYCGSTQTENVAATGHSYTVTETCEATCTESGHITSLCSKCGSVKEETIAPLGHSFVTYTVDPTCQHGGYWLQWCPICETLGSWLQLTDSVGHTYELKLTDVIPYDHDDGEIPEYCYRVYYNYECTMCDSECEDHFMMTYVDVSHDFCLDYEEEITILNEDGSEDIQLLKVYACSVCAVSFEELSFEKGFAATVVEWFESNQSYIWWLFLVFALAWAIFLGIKYAMSRGDGETAVARKAVADFVLGLLVIALICVCVPYLIYGIAAVVI